MPCVPAADDRERALREVAQVYERIKIQQPLLLLQYSSSSSSQPPSTTAHLAQSLLGEALRALNVALSVMQQQPPISAAAGAVTLTPTIKAEPEPQLSSPSPDAAAAPTTSTATRGKRKRSSVMMEGKNSSSSWVNLTRVPYEDGYEWRKYGEKKINGTSFTRSYFRCTYKDDTGCMAKKHIQQKDSSDPPMFQVTYNNDHTCNNCNTSSSPAKRNTSNNNRRLPFLAQASDALRPLDQIITTTLQEPPFPIPNQVVYSTTVNAHQIHAGGMLPSTTSTISSCITGLSSSTGYSADMAAAGDNVNDPLRDLEFFLMNDTDDSFKY